MALQHRIRCRINPRHFEHIEPPIDAVRVDVENIDTVIRNNKLFRLDTRKNTLKIRLWLKLFIFRILRYCLNLPEDMSQQEQPVSTQIECLIQSR